METEQTTTAAAENAGSVKDVMQSMTGAEPDAKPVTGEKAEGTKNSSQESGDKAPAWTSQLPDEMKSNKDLMKSLGQFAKIGDLAKKYSELESNAGKSIVVPGEDASEEEVNAYFKKLGRPDSADGYKGLEGDEKKVFRELAYKNGLTEKQATSLYKQMTEAGKAQLEAAKKTQEAQLTQTEKALHDEYGASYGEKMQLCKRGIETYGGKELGNILAKSGLLFNETIVKLFVRLGEETSEAGSTHKGAGGGVRQYKTTAAGGTFEYKL